MSNEQITIVEVRKRDGSPAPFNIEKISNAIHKALSASSKADDGISTKLAENVVKKLLEQGINTPSVEAIQDMVEATLIEFGYGDIAKSFILYRHERRKIRDEKKSVLNVKTLDPVAKKFDLQCLKVLSSRYLLRNSKNEIKETPEALFERVAILVGIGDIMYDSQVFSVDGGVSQDIDEAESYLGKLDSFDYKFKIGGYYLNKYHFRALVNHYITLVRAGHMKVGFKQLLELLVTKKFDSYADKIKEYFEMMTSQDFLPNSPTMMNAGGRLGQLSACFVLDMQDDMERIMKSSSDAALIFKSGGGVGINYSDLRPEGDIVASTSGVASGPVSFMNIINTITEVVKQGGKRRGANMGIMEVWHPDIEKFITNKTEAGVLENFNISVGLWEDFWQSFVSEDGAYTLRGPDKKIVREVNAHQLMDMIAMSAWRSAEPGLIFFDNINRYNVFAKARQAPLRATNPCGEQSLYPYESCNLGSINVANFVAGNEFDWQRYEEYIRKATRFLDNVIDVNLYPIAEINTASKESRRIGLGVMGVADLLYKLKIPYNSKEGYKMQSMLAEALTYYSMDESIQIAKSRGVFPLYPKTEYPEGKIPVSGYYEKPVEEHSYEWSALIEKIQKHGIRNVLTTTVAPTGTLSMLADCSNGMEPTFALAFEKHVSVGKFYYANRTLEKVLKENGLYSDELLAKIAENYGSLKGIDEIPQWMQGIFVTAMDIHWADHLMAQSVWQDWIGNAIAKTINMPYDVSAEDVKSSYVLAHELGLKGVTIYRDGSRNKQVLHMTNKDAEKKFSVEPSDVVRHYIDNQQNDFVRNQINEGLQKSHTSETVQIPTVEEDEKNKCPNCRNALTFSEGCCVCIECGFTECTSG